MRRFAIGATILLALAAGAGANPTKATFHFPGVSVDAGTLKARFVAERCPWEPECGFSREEWQNLLIISSSFHVSGVGHGIFTVRIDMGDRTPEPATVVRALALGMYHHYRSQRLAELSVLVPRQEQVVGLLTNELRTRQGRLGPLRQVVPGVLDAGRSLAASAERVEELRRRVSDARIETAVGGSRITLLRQRIAGLKEEVVEREIARLRAAKDKDVETLGIGPGHSIWKMHDKKIENLRSGAVKLPEHPLLDRFRDRLVDLEVDQIALEELAKALTKALEEEYERGTKLRAVAPELERLTREIETLEARVAEETRKRDEIGRERADLQSGKPVALKPK